MILKKKMEKKCNKNGYIDENKITEYIEENKKYQNNFIPRYYL